MEPMDMLTASSLLILLASSTALLYTWFTVDTLEQDY